MLLLTDHELRFRADARFFVFEFFSYFGKWKYIWEMGLVELRECLIIGSENTQELQSAYELLHETQEVTITRDEDSSIIFIDHETRMHDELSIDIAFYDFSLDEGLLEYNLESEVPQPRVKCLIFRNISDKYNSSIDGEFPSEIFTKLQKVHFPCSMYEHKIWLLLLSLCYESITSELITYTLRRIGSSCERNIVFIEIGIYTFS